MALLDDVMLALRYSDDAFEPEATALVSAALTDMRRAGVREPLLDPYAPYPLVRMATIQYAKANAGYDNPEAERFMASYRQTLADLLNSSANEVADDADFEAVSSFAGQLEG